MGLSIAFLVACGVAYFFGYMHGTVKANREWEVTLSKLHRSLGQRA